MHTYFWNSSTNPNVAYSRRAVWVFKPFAIMLQSILTTKQTRSWKLFVKSRNLLLTKMSGTCTMKPKSKKKKVAQNLREPRTSLGSGSWGLSMRNCETLRWWSLPVQFVWKRCRVTQELSSATTVFFFVGVASWRWTTIIAPLVDCLWMAELSEWKVTWDLYSDLINCNLSKVSKLENYCDFFMYISAPC